MNPDTSQESKTSFEVGESHAEEPRFIVGIGASAGGLETLQQLFEHLPPDTGMAFIVVQHLSPDFKSLMDELVRRHTEMAVFRVEDGMVVQRNAVYFIPPKKEMIISDRRLLLTDKDPSQGLTLPIDHFFRSLAQDAARRSIAVVLSGTGSDGSRGIIDVHEAGGLVIAQTTDTARFDGMPKSAVETGVVDFVLSPEEIAGTLLQLAEHPLRKAVDSPPEDDGLNQILKLLRDTYGLDFGHYKPSTVLRRIERRLLLRRTTEIDDYCKQLHDDPEELNQVYCDLLIGVTQFFRDREAFDYLEHRVLPDLMSQLPENDEVRLWVAGCATGEEAYSLAMLVDEQLQKSPSAPPIKIFATDVHRKSLDIASAGVYTTAALTDVSPERLKRYFRECPNGSYRIVDDLRKRIVFAPHNLIKDAPFTRLDLITCRNLLIYLQPSAQKKVLSLFHFGLKTGGVLFLGPSEGTGDLANEFDTLDQHWRFYRKRRDVRLVNDLRLPLSVAGAYSPADRTLPGPPLRPRVDQELASVYDTVLEEYMPPALLMDRRGGLVHAFRGAGRFLSVPDGRPSAGILDQLPAEVRTAVLGTMQRQDAGQPVVFRQVNLSTNQGPRALDVGVKSVQVPRSDERLVLITFAEPPQSADLHKEHDAAELDQASREQISVLESDLRYTRENLQAMIEELETSNEELQATNEELIASNEELQSTNEELHSVNEELYTVNAEHQKKIDELTELTADMDSLLESTQVHTIFLDNKLCIRKFTPQVAESFHLVAHDIGRRIDVFSSSIQSPNMIADVKSVLQTGDPVEQEVPDGRGRWFLLRILPYRKEDELGGVVLTLVDITGLKEAEFRFSGAVEASPEAMLVADDRGAITHVNAEVERRFGYSREELIGQPLEILMPEEGRDRHRILRNEYFKNPRVIRRMAGEPYIWGQRKDGNRLPLDVRVNPIATRDGTRVIASLIDISHHQALEASLREQVVQRDRFLATLSHELRNPLGAVINGVQLLHAASDNGELNSTALAAIERQSEQMSRLLDDLLDVSRVTAGKIKIQREIIDLRELCEDSIAAVRSQIDAHQHDLSVHVPDEDLLVEGDRVRLLQVIENLLSNAAKYTPDNGNLDLDMEASDGDAVIVVRDDGHGIPPELLPSIFDMFVQSDDTLDRAQGGMGVGLTLVRSLVHLHRGTITARSAGTDRGSEFEVRIPLTSQQRNRTRESVGPPRIVLVEDQDDSREMLCQLLKVKGCDVHTAADGTKGLATIIQERPDIALVDIGLPEIDGYEVARRVRSEPACNIVKLIALTGYGRQEDRQRVLAAGFDAHLVKPLNLMEIDEILGLPLVHPPIPATAEE
ncbi:MAG: chemotaxis protein CheR [Planctomycetaceae bacterium]|nr:chemotaxis protein CheR [Planctomycetaceae bacterium]